MTAILELEFDTDVAQLLARYRAWHVANQVNACLRVCVGHDQKGFGKPLRVSRPYLQA